MRQILQNLGSGETILAEVPCPSVRPGHLLIQTRRTLISPGTERMLIDFGKANLVQKALQQPERVKQVLAKIKTDGLMPTISAVQAKLDQPIPLGYSNVGTVLEVGEGVSGFTVGQRVLTNGAHAEIVCVPKNLAAAIPEGVSDDEAAFTVLGAIALQGVRLANPTLGEVFMVSGLGLIGLLAVQILKANGCRVIGSDFDRSRCEMAREFGAEAIDLSAAADLSQEVMTLTGGRGVDGVVITAATASDEPMHQAALMSRKRGRVILVGVVGLHLQRADFYEKELTFQVSCSYGPGRYDSDYEQRGRDYPMAYVRWTEQRNFEAVLGLLAERKLTVTKMVTQRFPFSQSLEAYEKVGQKQGLGFLLDYESGALPVVRETRVKLPPSKGGAPVSGVTVGFIGAGNFANQVLLPALKETGARLKTIASSAGVTGTHLGKKFGFEQSVTSDEHVFDDREVNMVFVASRHDSHGKYVIKALEAGKAVFVEKPLCIRRGELEEIQKLCAGGKSPFLMVGFNRRFAPQIAKLRPLLAGTQEPKAITMTINAGSIPLNSWVQSAEEGGGRILGEGCHFVDLCRFLVGHPITGVQAVSTTKPDASPAPFDTVAIQLRFADDSIATIQYYANGHKSFPKERIEVFCGGRVALVDNYRKMSSYGWPKLGKMNLWSQDKGHRAQIAATVNALREGKPAPIPAGEIFEVMETCFHIVEVLKSGGPAAGVA